MQVNRTQAPAIQDPVMFDFELAPIREEPIAGKANLYWLNAGVQEVAEISWVFPAGIWYEHKNAVAQATAGQLKNGTLTQSSRQINEALEFFGASLKVQAGNDYTTVTLDTLSKHIETLLPIVLDVLTNPVFPADELELYKQITIQRLLVSSRECEFVANQRIDAALFGKDHPYGRYSEVDTVRALSVEDLRCFHREHYRFSEMKVFMSGNITEEHVRMIHRFFGAVAGESGPPISPENTFTVQPSAQQWQHIINDEQGVQGAIRVGRRFIRRSHPDFASVVVLNTLFGGYFGSRLMSNIREDKGYTYGIYSSIGAYAHDATLTVHTEVGRDVIRPALEEVYREMDILCQDRVGEEELLLVKNYLLGNILGDLDGPFSIMQRWRSLILNGFGIERFHENIRTYKEISVDRIRDLAQQYLCKDDFMEIVVI